MNLKSIAKGSTESFTVDNGIILLKQTNDNEFATNLLSLVCFNKIIPNQ